MTRKKTYGTLLICMVFGMGFIALLFTISEHGLHRDNSFIRRFPGHPAIQDKKLDLTYDSYYIAGVDQEQIYLGNTTAPLHAVVMDTALQNKKTVRLSIDQDSLPFKFLQLRVIPPYFFLADGTTSYIGRGKTTDWKAHAILNASAFFSKIEPIDSSHVVIRAVSSATQESVLGKISLLDTSKVEVSHELLQKQVDGMFDVDGVLLYNRQLQKLVYTYFYRNQYIVADNALQLDHFGKTIDTISRAQIKVGTIASKGLQKMAAPALTVNKYSATYGPYLFVNSKLVGRYEPIEVWDYTSIIDVYNIVENTYLFSFHVYDIGEDKLRSFQVFDDKFIGLIGNHIVTYQMGRHYFKDLPPVLGVDPGPKITAITDGS